MNLTLTDKRLDFNFLFCFVLTIFIPSLLPSLKLSFFAPFLIIVCYQKNLQNSLWLALLCGLILDLLSSHARLGIHALNFCFTLVVLYPQKRNFFADSLSTLPMMTFFFAIVSSVFMALLLYSLETKNVMSWNWVFSDLLMMSAADAMYAFCCFILPAMVFGRPVKKGKDYFLSQ
jgi:rod shape-determining protein MreD